MNNNVNITQAKLEELIERYFEAQTTESEEEELRRVLTSGKYTVTSEIEAVKAMLSLRSCDNTPHKINKRLWLEVTSVAASIVLIISIAIRFASRSNDICEMYIAGVEYSDDGIIMQCIEDDFALINGITSATSSMVTEQLSEFIITTNPPSDN